MEPLLIGSDSRHRPELDDMAAELAQRSTGLRRSLPDNLLSRLAELVRSMHCYYSNLIERHDTHPADIERALKGDYSNAAKKRDLQLEATAHITGQGWIDTGGRKGRHLPYRVSVALTEEQHAALDAAARNNGAAVSWVVRRAVIEFLASNERRGWEKPLPIDNQTNTKVKNE